MYILAKQFYEHMITISLMYGVRGATFTSRTEGVRNVSFLH